MYFVESRTARGCYHKRSEFFQHGYIGCIGHQKAFVGICNFDRVNDGWLKRLKEKKCKELDSSYYTRKQKQKIEPLWDQLTLNGNKLRVLALVVSIIKYSHVRTSHPVRPWQMRSETISWSWCTGHWEDSLSGGTYVWHRFDAQTPQTDWTFHDYQLGSQYLLGAQQCTIDYP